MSVTRANVQAPIDSKGTAVEKSTSPIPRDPAVIGPVPPTVYSDILALLQSLAEEAAHGKVQGLAVVVMRAGGSFDLMVRGSAREEAHHMAVVGMLTALQKAILEAH
jgi:hypothetical protein